jgi:hypothetical protein
MKIHPVGPELFHAAMTNLIVTFSNSEYAPKTHRGKALPLQAWTGPEGSRRMRLPDFKTICI